MSVVYMEDTTGMAEQFLYKMKTLIETRRMDILFKLHDWLGENIDAKGIHVHVVHAMKNYLRTAMLRLIHANNDRWSIHRPTRHIVYQYQEQGIPGIHLSQGRTMMDPILYDMADWIDMELASSNVVVPVLTTDVACQCDPEPESVFVPMPIRADQDRAAVASAFEIDWITDNPKHRVTNWVTNCITNDMATNPPKRWKEDIKEIKRDMKEMMSMLQAVYEFENEL